MGQLGSRLTSLLLFGYSRASFFLRDCLISRSGGLRAAVYFNRRLGSRHSLVNHLLPGFTIGIFQISRQSAGENTGSHSNPHSLSASILRATKSSRIWGAHAPRVSISAPSPKFSWLTPGDWRGRQSQHARARALSRPKGPSKTVIAIYGC
jgi:hypothetical protein